MLKMEWKKQSLIEVKISISTFEVKKLTEVKMIKDSLDRFYDR